MVGGVSGCPPEDGSADSHLRVCPGLPVQCTHVLWSLYTLSAYLFNLFTLLFTKYNSSLQLPVLRSFLRFLEVIFTQNLIPFSLSSIFKNNLNLRLTWLERMQRYMSGVCAHSSIYIVTYFYLVFWERNTYCLGTEVSDNTHKIGNNNCSFSNTFKIKLSSLILL